MIDDQTRKLIKEYLPNPPDPELGFEEFYYLQCTARGEQVIKVKVKYILPGDDHGGIEYGIYQVCENGLRWVNVGWGDRNRGCYRSQLYDNREDCRNQAHMWVRDWERLREIQREEGLI